MAVQTAKKPLGFDVYDGWKAIAGVDLSRDGRILTYAVNPQVGDGILYVLREGDSKALEFPRGSAARFTADSKYLLATIVPPKADVDRARKEKKAPRDQPKNQLLILDLQSGTPVTIDRVKSWRMPARDAGWLLYQLDEPPAPKPTETAAPPKPPVEDQTGAQEPKKEEPKAQEPKKEEPKKKKEHAVGSEWIARHVATGKEFKLADVAEIQFDDAGDSVLYAVSTKTGDKDGVYWLDLPDGKTTTIAAGMGQYRQFAIHKQSGQVAFSTDRDRYAKEPTEWAVHLWKPGQATSREVASNATAGIPAGSVLPGRGQLAFSWSGKRLLLVTAPKPEPEAKPADPDEEKAVLDVWSWTDRVLMPTQILRAAADRNRTFGGVLELDSGKFTQLEDARISVNIPARGDSAYALGMDDTDYQMASTWGEEGVDVFVVDTRTGGRRQLFKRMEDGIQASLDGRFAYYFDGDVKHWFSIELATGERRNISDGIAVPLWNVDDDHPARSGPAGPAMQTEDGRLVVSDGYDLWILDLGGRRAPECLTDGVGRVRGWRFGIQSFPREDDGVGLNVKDPILLSVVDRETYATGFFRDRFDTRQAPEKLIMGDYNLAVAAKSEDTDRLAVRRQTFVEYPDLWLTDLSFSAPRKVSEANPQQKDYIWGKAELIHWISADGVALKGALIKPENFDAAKKYPMIVYFYERESDQLHVHRVPSPSASTINPTEYASNGYIVFIPDIPYTVGYPGESAEKAIISGTLEVVRRGYVDPKRIGIQGQSWGGYQVMHLITRTKLYAAAGAGAAVSNMTSAYGGIRLGSGLVRQMQYEAGQSRIGGSIWETPLRYFENSPLFWADKVETPVLMMNNDADDAVPFSQGVEMFTALRRLGKPAWMLNYNNDKHNLTQRANRKDLSIRLMQFFNHYLKGEPAPKWMTEGVPAVNKGKDYGLALPEGKKSGG